MNTIFPSHSPRKENGGAALVIVLAILVLVAGFSVALLNLAVTQRQSAATFLANSKTRELGDTAVGIVQAQINHATTQGSTVAWASQPGMMRTYTTSGALDKAYKLYSASSLTETNPASLANDLPPGDWASSPALWTDINAPVVSGGRSVYPIVDPGILDMPANTAPLGFSISSAPGATNAQRAPMPVKWLYVLEDGQIVAPLGSGNTVTVAGSSVQNPVVGRIAFWTDDESCKVNLNTAGAGSLWDTPRFYSTEDVNFANSQPLNGEFQRYPGHPAMTSLSAIFPGMTDQQILSSITPRYQWGGSQQGAVNTYDKSDALNGGVLANAPLYTDTDEIAFKASYTDRSLNGLFSRDTIERTRFFLTTDSHSPEINLFNLPRVACWPIATATDKRTAFDQVIALAASIGSYPYYFQRANALSPTEDAAIQRNQQLFGYLQYLTNQKIPGFGVKLADKFGADNDQILTEVWDYIRSTNLYDSRLATGKQFTAEPSTQSNGYGYVVPLEAGSAANPNRGFGRSLTLTKLAFVFICTADPVDTQTGQGHPFSDGMLHSNDPAKNRTLGGTALTTGQRRVQMMIVPQFFSPSMGNVLLMPKNVLVEIRGLSSLTLAGNGLFPGNTASSTFAEMRFNGGWHRRAIGGTLDYRAVFGGSTGYTQCDPGILDTPSYPLNKYPWISKFVSVPVPNPGTSSPGSMTFGTGELTVTIRTSTNGSDWVDSQIIKISPPASTSIPIPNLVRVGTGADRVGTDAETKATRPENWWAFSYTSPYTGASGGRLVNLIGNPGYYKVAGGVPLQSYTDSALSGTLFREVESSSYYTDVVRTMELVHDDARLVAGLKTVPSAAYSPLGDWSSATPLLHSLSTGLSKDMYIPGGTQFRRHFVTTAKGLDDPAGQTGNGGQWAPDFRSDASSAILDAVKTSGDFDNGPSAWPDGAYINKPDEGNIYSSSGSRPYFDFSESEKLNSVGFFSPNRIMPGPGMLGSLPTHLRRYQSDAGNPEKYAWRTLLFRKQPSHPNAVTIDSNGIPTSAPDHLLMDLFWMPTVEPYAISEPFTSDGKVNMNYQIQPFTYIKRATGLYAVLKAEKIPAVENTDMNYTNYKALLLKSSPSPPPASASYRLNLDVPATLSQFDTRFSASSGRLFLSPSELCDLWLVPQGQSLSSMETFWKSRNLTGDNMRERPYTTIIPRLTTKSNTFTVYYRVQSLRQPRSAAGGTWSDATGTISGEYRGSATIQRFIDLNNTTLLQTDFATNTLNRPTLDTFYRWRVLSSKQFAP